MHYDGAYSYVKSVLHCYKRRSRGRTFPHNEDSVLEYTKLFFNEYCRSNLYTEDVGTGVLSSASMAKIAPKCYIVMKVIWLQCKGFVVV
jgi:hypothetical protein